MRNYISIAQSGNKKDRVHQVIAQSKDTQNTKVFTVKGVGKSFVIFEGAQQIDAFKTLGECKNYISQVTV